MELILLIVKDIQPGRLVESLIFLAVLLSRIKPHLKKFDARLAGLADIVEKGFNSGEQRFTKIEERLHALETTPTEGSHHDGKSL